MNESLSLDFRDELEQEEGLLGNFFYISFVSHIAVVFLFYLYNSSFFKLEEKKQSLMKSFVRVDVVSMPTLTIKELKSLKLDRNFKKSKTKHLNKTEKVPDVREVKTLKRTPKVLPRKVEKLKDDLIFKEKTKIKTKKVKRKIKERKIDEIKKVESTSIKNQGNVLDLIKNLGTKKVKTLKRAKRRKRVDNSLGVKFGGKNSKIIKNLLIEGNKISKGENIIEGKTLLKEEEGLQVITDYISKVRRSVRSYWKLPEYLKDNKNYRCRIQIFISDDGSLMRLNVIEASGNEEFDKRALQTVEMAAPFPPVDPIIRKRVLNGDLILGFPL